MIPLLPTATAAITWDPPPSVGTESTASFIGADGQPVVGTQVHLIHRPGLPGERDTSIGITDGQGQLRWMPDEAGLKRLVAGETSEIVAVSGPPPYDTLAHLLLIGAIGLIWALTGRTLPVGR